MTEELTPDDVKVGDWFAVIDSFIADSNPDAYIRLKFIPDGIPWRVVAVSLPFVLATDNVRHMSFYMPMFKLRRVTKQYVKVFHESVSPHRKNYGHE